MEIYQVILRASPLPVHPQYWAWQGAGMIVLVRAGSEAQAQERARAFLALVDWEVLSVEESEPLATLEPPPRSDEWSLAVQTAESWGIGLVLAAWHTGGGNEPLPGE